MIPYGGVGFGNSMYYVEFPPMKAAQNRGRPVSRE